MVGFACVETDVPDTVAVCMKNLIHVQSSQRHQAALPHGTNNFQSCVEVSEKASAPGAGATGQGDLRLSTRRKLHDTILALIRIGPLNQHTEMFSTNRQVILQA